MDEPVKLSVIVPAYNCEHTLTECVQSILNQDEASMEILLVDDGSTDNTPAICDRLAKADDRIKVIHQQNKGVGAARNVGLQQARGGDITFVDADDVISSGTYKENLHWMDKHPKYNVLQFPCTEKYKRDDSYQVKYRDECLVEGDVNVFYMWLVEKRIRSYVWNKIYRACFIKQFSFLEGAVFEDRFLMCDILTACERVYLSPKGLYHYFFEEGQISCKSLLENARSLFNADHHMVACINAYIHVPALRQVLYERLNNCIYYLQILRNNGENITKEKNKLNDVLPTIGQLIRYSSSIGIKFKLLLVRVIGLDWVLKTNI